VIRISNEEKPKYRSHAIWQEMYNLAISSSCLKFGATERDCEYRELASEVRSDGNEPVISGKSDHKSL
jgi:hypothetical protein